MTQLEFELNDRDIEDHEIIIDVNRKNISIGVLEFEP